MRTTRTALAEWVSPGHPDRLADAIAESLVQTALGIDAMALVGVEVAVHTDKVFVDGRIAAGPCTPVIDVEGIVREVYRSAGYGGPWSPAPSGLHILQDLCREPLHDDERAIRAYSDDQNVVVGYANRIAGCNGLPPAHAVAARIGRAVAAWRAGEADRFGPDFKVLPRLGIERGPDGTPRYTWERLTLSIQHAPGIGYEEQHRALRPVIEAALLEAQQAGLAGIADSFHAMVLHLNGAGDFCQGGPHGDNGLSGKKLVVDHYGPTVPIGGGALCGKDPHKVDRCGALRARQLAKQLCRTGADEAWVTLAWSPGESVPFLREVHAEPLLSSSWRMPEPEWFSIPRIVADLELCSVDWVSTLRAGYLQDPEAAWER